MKITTINPLFGIALEKRKFAFLVRFLPLLKELKDDPLHLNHLYERQGIFYEKAYQNLNKEPFFDNQIIEAADFEQAIRTFLQQNNLSRLSELFEAENYPGWFKCAPVEYKKLLLKSFFANPTIARFTTRNTITFNESLYPNYHPIEIEFYLSASKKSDTNPKPLSIPYRTQKEEKLFLNISVDNSNPYKLFYSKGASRKNIQGYLKMIKKLMPELAESYIRIIFPLDSYRLGVTLTKLSQLSLLGKNARGYAYIISATPKDNHIYPVLSIINTNTKKIHFHLILNSWQNDDYVAETSRQINFQKAEKIILFDGCLSIQINDGDNNCSQYTTLICRALSAVLSSNDKLQDHLEKIRYQRC